MNLGGNRYKRLWLNSRHFFSVSWRISEIHEKSQNSHLRAEIWNRDFTRKCSRSATPPPTTNLIP